MLWSVLFAAAPLSLADVQSGEFVEYVIDHDITLRVMVCETRPGAVTLGVTVARPAGGFPSILDGFRLDQPTAPLVPPAQLPQPAEVVSEGEWKECGVWKLPATFHGMNGTTTRCAARELILGGGLLRMHHSVFPVTGRGFSDDVTLKAHGRSDVKCPPWPKVKVAGKFRTQQNGEAPVSHVITTSGSWVRDQDGDTYLLDLFAFWARKRAGQGAAEPSSLKLGGRAVETWLEVGEGYRAHWPKLEAVRAAPLEVQVTPLLETSEGKTFRILDWK